MVCANCSKRVQKTVSNKNWYTLGGKKRDAGEIRFVILSILSNLAKLIIALKITGKYTWLGILVVFFYLQNETHVCP